MKKRFIGALLLGAFVTASTSMFVSCKDYDDDISNLQTQINNLDGTVKSQITVLNTSLTTLEAAYKSDDAATLAAAKQAVADAKAALEAALAGDKAELEAAIVKAQSAVEQAIKLLDENKADKADLKKVQDDLGGVQTNLQTAMNEFATMKEDVRKALAELSDLTNALSGQQAALETVEEGAHAVKTSLVDLQKRADELEDQMKVLAGLINISGGETVVDISEVTIELANLRQMVLDLSDKINDDPGSQFNTIIVALSKALRSLVFQPHFYLDGIEAVNYKWIGDTTLVLYQQTNFPDLGHHGTYDPATGNKDLHDISGEINDWVPNTLGRYYDTATKQILTGFGVRKPGEATTYNTDREWIYGPVWPVYYHMNPSTALVNYANDAPSFYVLEPDVIYYNTRAKASALNITSPEKYEYYEGDGTTAPAVFGADSKGILTVGLKIEHPDALAPWPTDETINPNGNTTAGTQSYPANQTGGNQPFAGAKTDEAYTNAEYGTYGNWYGFARYKYNKNNTDNTIALQMHKTDDQGGMVTSDYALIVPTRVQLEGLVWYKKPQYIEPNMPGYNYGPGGQDGDEEGWATGEGYDCNTKRVHIWDTPEEAIADPRGASLELGALDASGVDLRPYLGIHALVENYKKKETAPGIYDGYPYDLVTLKYGEEKAYGLHYEFELVEYISSRNQTSDSKYATFSDWTTTTTRTYNGVSYEVIKDWNNTSSKTGVIIAREVTPDAYLPSVNDGTLTTQSATSVDREPLVRVLLKNEAGKVLLDGYILLHINHTPDNQYVDNYPEEGKTFDLCNPITLTTYWSQFSNYVLKEKLKLTNKSTGTQILAFHDWYWADCVTDGTPVIPEDSIYVNPFAHVVGGPVDSHMSYQLKIFNLGTDVYGNNPIDPIYGGSHNDKLDTGTGYTGAFENDALGVATFYPAGQGTTNQAWSWTLSPAEIEYLTHHDDAALKSLNGAGVKVTRWIRFYAKDLDRGRSVNNYSAPYPYIWVKMTMTITRDEKTGKYKEKIDNRWYNWNPQSTMTNAEAENGWSAWLIDIEAPRDGQTTRDERWIGYLSNTLVTNKGVVSGLTNQQFKYYFTPKTDYKITALNGTEYTITPKNIGTGRYIEPIAARNIPAPIGGGTKDYNNANTWDQMFCKYVTYSWNVAPYLSNSRTTLSSILQDKHAWDEQTLKKTLLECAIIYDDENGKNAGVFNDSLLFASYRVGSTDYYTPIARIVKQEQNGAATYHDAGAIELIHYLPIGSTAADRNAGNAVENVVLYDVLNAMGYPLLADNTCDYDHAQKFINEQLRAWVGVVAVNNCNVALYVEQEKYDDNNIATFLPSWQRPINLQQIPIQPALDARTQENFLYLIDYIKLFDWRGDLSKKDGYMYSVDAFNFDKNHFWFWAYYNVKGIKIDLRPSEVWTNMHKNLRPASQEWVRLSQVTTQERLEAIDPVTNRSMGAVEALYGEGWVTERGTRYGNPWVNNPWNLVGLGYNRQDQEANLEAYMGINPIDNARKAKFGGIYYENNGTNLTVYDVAIPITIFYEWGALEIRPEIVNGKLVPNTGLIWHIDSTHGRSDSN